MSDSNGELLTPGSVDDLAPSRLNSSEWQSLQKKIGPRIDRLMPELSDTGKECVIAHANNSMRGVLRNGNTTYSPFHLVDQEKQVVVMDVELSCPELCDSQEAGSEVGNYLYVSRKEGFYLNVSKVNIRNKSWSLIPIEVIKNSLMVGCIAEIDKDSDSYARPPLEKRVEMEIAKLITMNNKIACPLAEDQVLVITETLKLLHSVWLGYFDRRANVDITLREMEEILQSHGKEPLVRDSQLIDLVGQILETHHQLGKIPPKDTTKRANRPGLVTKALAGLGILGATLGTVHPEPREVIKPIEIKGHPHRPLSNVELTNMNFTDPAELEKEMKRLNQIWEIEDIPILLAKK